MNDSHGKLLCPSASPDVDAICDAFEAAWLAGHQPRIEDFLPRGDPAHQDMLLQELLLAEWDLRHEHGPQAELSTCLARFPESRRAITDLWRIWNEEQADRRASRSRSKAKPGSVTAGLRT